MRQPLPEPVIAPNLRTVVDIRDWIVTELSASQKVDRMSIDTGAPLYSLGVDSVTAIGVTGALATWLDRDLPATLMWDHPTIDAIAEALGGTGTSMAPERPGMVTLQSQGNCVPLFCFPGAGGHSTTFAPLATCIGGSHPCFGLTVPGLNREHAPLQRVEDIAAVMLNNIRRVQPRGPYQLAGYSFGGLLALEVAQQLRALGERVPLLAIYDTFTPEGLVLRPRWQRLLLHAHVLMRRPERGEYIRKQLQRRRKERQAANIGRGEATGRHQHEKLAAEVELANTRAITRYRPRPYADSVLLFRALNRKTEAIFYRIEFKSNGWGALTDGRVRIVDLPGSHESILSVENARGAAEKLRPYLSEERCTLA